MEFQEVMKTKDRMCKFYKANHCVSCPLSYKNNPKNCDCFYLILHYPQEFEEICKKWAEENPIISNAEKFEEIFGERPNKDICLFIDCDECDLGTCSGCKYKDFWKKEYKEPKKD